MCLCVQIHCVLLCVFYIQTLYIFGEVSYNRDVWSTASGRQSTIWWIATRFLARKSFCKGLLLFIAPNCQRCLGEQTNTWMQQIGHAYACLKHMRPVIVGIAQMKFTASLSVCFAGFTDGKAVPYRLTSLGCTPPLTRACLAMASSYWCFREKVACRETSANHIP